MQNAIHFSYRLTLEARGPRSKAIIIHMLAIPRAHDIIGLAQK